MQQRFRGQGVRWQGWLIADVADRHEDQTIGVYWRLGRWRIFGSDDPAPRAAAAIARRLLAEADINEARDARRREVVG